MGKRSQSLTAWPKRHDTPFERQGRVWICASCRTRGCQLIACSDGRQRCPTCKGVFESDRSDPSDQSDIGPVGRADVCTRENGRTGRTRQTGPTI